MLLAGPYTGAEDSVIDVEVLGGPGSALRASTPVVTGVGNGTLDVESIDIGAAAQTMKFTLLDEGTSPTQAILDFFGVQLAARAVGTAGNLVTLAVAQGLTFTNMQFATLEPMTTGTSTFDGPQFDWGQPAATATGITANNIPASALRINFFGFPTVYRSWKTWDSGRFTYHVDPPLAYDIPENVRIRSVTGDYTLTVTDGTTTETYTATTLYDFLSQVQARSTLVQVLGVVAADHAPGGQAVTDIPLRTQAHALPVIASIIRNGATMLVGDVDPATATQNVTVVCLGSNAGGNQSWSVKGGVSGVLPAASTGVLYTDGPVQFTIQKPPVAVALDNAITAKFLPTSRGVDEGLPSICFKPLLLGAAATNKEITFEYRQRPPDECSCSTATALQVSLQCLGLAADGGGTMDAEYQSRLITLYEWNAEFIASNVALVGLDQTDIDIATSCTGILATALAEIYQESAARTAWDGVLTELQAELAPFMNLASNSDPAFSVYGGSSTVLGASAWNPRGMAVGGSYINPVNNHRYTITAIHIDSAAVNSTPVDSTFPIANTTAWSTGGGSFTVTEDTDVVLHVTDMGIVPVWGEFALDRVFFEINPDVHPAGVLSQVRVTKITVDGTDADCPADVTWDSDRFNTSGVLTGVVTGDTVKVVVSSVRLPQHPAGATVQVGDELVNPLNHHGYKVVTVTVATVSVNAASARLPDYTDTVWATDASTFDLTMPAAVGRTAMTLTVTDAALVTPATTSGGGIDAGFRDPYFQALRLPPNPGDGSPTALWQASVDTAKTQWQDATLKSTFDQRAAFFNKVVQYFPQKYAAKMNWVRTVAGVPPKASAGSAGSPCWHDYGDGFWWEDVNGFYLPAFTNQPFVSATRLPDGKIVSTQEFGFGLITQCDHRLKVGDRFTISINGTNSQNTWAEGDRFVIPLVSAASAPLVGGDDGDTTQTWTVRSSVLGALVDYAFVPSAPVHWAHTPATVILQPGGIPFEVGDSLAFDIEGGEFRWRRDSGSWTTDDLYGTSPIDLGDGLMLTPQAGSAPSFIVGDTWQFSAIATYGTQRMRQPRIGQAFAWDGATCTLNIDMLSSQPVENVMMAMHNIPLGATVVVHGGVADTSDWSATATMRKGLIQAVVPRGDTLTSARYLQVVITGSGSGGSMGWLWAGVGWQPTVGPSVMKIKRQYGLARGAAINPSAIYRGVGNGGSWEWNLDAGAALFASSARGLVEIVDYSAEQGLEPIALFPDILDDVDASVVLLDFDEFEMAEFANWQDSGTNVVSLSLPLRGVLA